MNAIELASQITGKSLVDAEALEEIRKWVISSYDFHIDIADLKKCISDATRPNNFESLIRGIMTGKKKDTTTT